MKRIQFYAILSLLSLCLPGCSDTSGFKDEPHPGTSGSGIANIELDISLLDLAANVRTRADEDKTDYVQGSNYENIKTLRIIIIDKDGYVEHNRYVDFEQARTDYSMTFKVKANENKDIYIFANELSEDWEGNGYYPFRQLLPGISFKSSNQSGSLSPEEELESLIIKSNVETKVLFDNTGENKTYIPINEHYEFSVGAAPTGIGEVGTEENPYEIYCPITRAATKFTFNVTYEGTANLTDNAVFKVEEIHFSQIGDQEYLLPKDTKYNPAINIVELPEEGKNINRQITEYSVPEEAANTDLIFPVNLNFDKNTGPQTWEKDLYYPETRLNPGEKYKVRIKTTTEEDESWESNWADLPNLDILPRNTHVKINIKIKKNEINCTVDLVPYTGVYLEPDFGVNRPEEQP